MQNVDLGENMLSMGPVVRLMGLSWVCLLIIYFLPFVWWGIILKFIFGIFLFSIAVASFMNIWKNYETMGAFVTCQIIFFAGILWLPDGFYWLKYIFFFLILVGISTMNKHVKYKNK